MSLPTPVLSCDDVVMVQDYSYQSARVIWKNWSRDPIKAAVLRAILSHQSRLENDNDRVDNDYFSKVMSVALGQNRVCSFHSVLLEVDESQY
jgi:hypothetical protein